MARLRPLSTTTPSFGGGAEQYHCWGWHLSTARAGDVCLQDCAYNYLDNGDDAVVATLLLQDNPDLTRDEALAIVVHARGVRELCDGVARLLQDAVEAWQIRDLDATIKALDAASSLESEGGDDPSTSDLRRKLLADDDETDWQPADLVQVRSDAGDGGWSLHAPCATDEAIAAGDAPYLLSGPSEWDAAAGCWTRPNADDYDAAFSRFLFPVGTAVVAVIDGEKGVVLEMPESERARPGGSCGVYVAWEQGVRTWTPRDAIEWA